METEHVEEWIDHFRLKTNQCVVTKQETADSKAILNGIRDEEMMTEITRELTAIKETNITSEEVLCRKRVEYQRAQKTLLKPTKRDYRFQRIRCHKEDRYTNHSTHKTQKVAEENTKTNVNTVPPFMNHKDVNPMARAAQDVVEQFIAGHMQKHNHKCEDSCYQGEGQGSS